MVYEDDDSEDDKNVGESNRSVQKIHKMVDKNIRE